LSDEKKEELATKKNSWFVDYIEAIKPEEIFKGVKQMLNSLRENGYKVALASSSKNAETVLRLLEIKGFFDAVVDGTMIIKSKPDPEIFLLAASKVGVYPNECIVFEDAEAGVEAAIAAGMKCVGVGSADQLSKANFIVKSTADFNISQLQTI